MFRWFWNLFATKPRREAWHGLKFYREREDNVMATIKKIDNGFGLFGRSGLLLGIYSRARDARRGAARRGLVVA